MFKKEHQIEKMIQKLWLVATYNKYSKNDIISSDCLDFYHQLNPYVYGLKQITTNLLREVKIIKQYIYKNNLK